MTEPATDTRCSGIEIHPSEDGPTKYACTCDDCTPAVVKRYVEPGFTAAMLAAIPSDEEF